MTTSKTILQSGTALVILLGVLAFWQGPAAAQDANFQTTTINGVTGNYNMGLTQEQLTEGRRKLEENYTQKKDEIEKAIETMKTNPHLTPDQLDIMIKTLWRERLDNEETYKQAIKSLAAQSLAIYNDQVTIRQEQANVQVDLEHQLLTAEQARVTDELRALGADTDQAMKYVWSDWTTARSTPCDSMANCAPSGFKTMTTFRSAQADTLIAQVKGARAVDAQNAANGTVAALANPQPRRSKNELTRHEMDLLNACQISVSER